MKNAKHAGVASALVALCLTPLSGAQVLDFEDLVPSTVYPNGSSFVTGGVTVNVGDFTFFPSGDSFSGGQSNVLGSGSPGSGQAMGMGNVVLDFIFGGPIPSISFKYDDAGGNINLVVNGDLFNAEDFTDADGQTVGGASVSVMDTSGTGMVTITGSISQFAVGGQEFGLDDVRGIPTPGVVSVMGLAGLAAARRRR